MSWYPGKIMERLTKRVRGYGAFERAPLKPAEMERALAYLRDALDELRKLPVPDWLWLTKRSLIDLTYCIESYTKENKLIDATRAFSLWIDTYSILKKSLYGYPGYEESYKELQKIYYDKMEKWAAIAARW
jgi:hypothetical protein